MLCFILCFYVLCPIIICVGKTAPGCVVVHPKGDGKPDIYVREGLVLSCSQNTAALWKGAEGVEMPVRLFTDVLLRSQGNNKCGMLV